MNTPERRLWPPAWTTRIAEQQEALAMLVTQERAVDRWDLQGAYFDGSLELLRKLAVTIGLDAALPRLSAIVSKMLPHDALRVLRSTAATGRERVDRRRAGHDHLRWRRGDRR
jgi:hypothetical protein